MLPELNEKKTLSTICRECRFPVKWRRWNSFCPQMSHHYLNATIVPCSKEILLSVARNRQISLDKTPNNPPEQIESVAIVTTFDVSYVSFHLKKSFSKLRATFIDFGTLSCFRSSWSQQFHSIRKTSKHPELKAQKDRNTIIRERFLIAKGRLEKNFETEYSSFFWKSLSLECVHFPAVANRNSSSFIDPWARALLHA